MSDPKAIQKAAADRAKKLGFPYAGAQLPSDANKPNPEFIGDMAAAVSKDDPVMFIRRSGARSHSAAEAAMRAGWKETYNVLEGFEGDKDAAQHRNSAGGRRKAGLPWIP